VLFEKRWLRANLFGFSNIAQTNPYETIALMYSKSHSLSQLEGALCQLVARRWSLAETDCRRDRGVDAGTHSPWRLGQERGFFHAFMIGRRYVSILAIGPEANKAELSQAAAAVRIEAKLVP
jgi:hypothetical protein